jgi:hypothetical protein
MALAEPSERAHSIVLIGSFNPAIFQPAWLAHRGLIAEEDAERAEVVLISDDVAAFSLAWARIEVARDRFSMVATPTAPSPEYLRDLVLGIFQALEHTPVSNMGINYMAHMRAPDEATWHALGHQLAPVEPWLGIFANPGLASLQVQEPRPDGYTGSVNVTVEPSARVKPGVYIAVNDHYQFEVKEDARPVLQTLPDVWSASVARSYQYVDHISALA